MNTRGNTIVFLLSEKDARQCETLNTTPSSPLEGVAIMLFPNNTSYQISVVTSERASTQLYPPRYNVDPSCSYHHATPTNLR
jgi:hypothetical protein